MSLLFDQNISYRIIKIIEPVYSGAIHISKAHLVNASDSDIWHFAKANSLCIVTSDADFIDIAMLKGCPPKIIWLRLGNTSTESTASRLIADKPKIFSFLSDPDSAFLQIG